MASRRKTLGTLSSSQTNSMNGAAAAAAGGGRLSLGPSKLNTKASNGRKSLGGGYNKSTADDKENANAFSRLSLGGSQGNNTARRKSLSSSAQIPSEKRKSLGGQNLNATVGRPSLAPKDSKLPQQTGRRSSTYGTTNTSIKPQRLEPVNDKNVINSNIEKLIQYLVLHSYDRPLSKQLLLQPTTADFKAVFEFLVRMVDPYWYFSAKPEVKDKNVKVEDPFIDEVLLLLRMFKYPYTINRSRFQTITAQHCWPEFLSMLVWVCEHVEKSVSMYQQLDDDSSQYSLSALSEGIESVDDNQRQLIYRIDEAQFFQQMYHQWLTEPISLQLTDPEAEEERQQQVVSDAMAARFGAVNQSLRVEQSKLEATTITLQHQLQTYEKHHQQLLDIQASHQTLTHSVMELQQLIAGHEQSKQQLQLKLDELKHERELCTQAIEQYRQSNAALEHEISLQPYTPTQIEQMRQQQRLMDETLQNIQAQKQKVMAEMNDVELQMMKKVQEIEKHTDEYNTVGLTIELLPAGAKYSNGTDYTLHVDTQAVHTKPQQLLNQDLKQVIKPLLASMERTIREKYTVATSELREMSDSLTVLQEKVTDENERVQGLKARGDKVESTLKKEKETMNTQLKTAVTQVEDAELALHQMRTAHTQNTQQAVYAAEQQHQLSKQDHQHQYQQQAAVREQLCNEVKEVMNEVLVHREKVQQTLLGLVQNANQSMQQIQQLHHSVPI